MVCYVLVDSLCDFDNNNRVLTPITLKPCKVQSAPLVVSDVDPWVTLTTDREQTRDGPIWSGIGFRYNVIHWLELSNPTCENLQSMRCVCPLMLSAEMTLQVIPGWSASWLQTAEWISWMDVCLDRRDRRYCSTICSQQAQARKLLHTMSAVSTLETSQSKIQQLSHEVQYH